MKLKKLLATLVLAACAAQTLADVPVPSFKDTYISDPSGVLSASQKLSLNKQLQAIDKSGKAVMVVSMVPSLDGESIENYTMAIGSNGHIGHSDRQDGIILAIAVKDREVRMEVARGVSGNLTDVGSRDIIEGTKPYFKSGDFAGGIAEAIKVVDQKIPQPLDSTITPNISSETLLNRGSTAVVFLVWGVICGLLAIILSIVSWRGYRQMKKEEEEEKKRLTSHLRYEDTLVANVTRSIYSGRPGSIHTPIPEFNHSKSRTKANHSKSRTKVEEYQSKPTLDLMGTTWVTINAAEVASLPRGKEDYPSDPPSSSSTRSSSSSSALDFSPSTDSGSDSSSSSFDGGGSSSTW